MGRFYLLHNNVRQEIAIFMNNIYLPAISILNYALVMKLIISSTQIMFAKVFI